MPSTSYEEFAFEIPFPEKAQKDLEALVNFSKQKNVSSFKKLPEWFTNNIHFYDAEQEKEVIRNNLSFQEMIDYFKDSEWDFVDVSISRRDEKMYVHSVDSPNTDGLTDILMAVMQEYKITQPIVFSSVITWSGNRPKPNEFGSVTYAVGPGIKKVMTSAENERTLRKLIEDAIQIETPEQISGM